MNNNNKYGFFITKNELIIPQYDEVGKFHNMKLKECPIRVKKDGKWGYVRICIGTLPPRLVEIIPPKYDYAEDFEGTIKLAALVTLDNEQFYIDRDGNIVEV